MAAASISRTARSLWKPAAPSPPPRLNGDTTDQLIVDGTLNLTGGGPGVGSNNTINAGGVVNMNAAEAVTFTVNGGTFVSDNAYQTATFNFTGTGGEVDLSDDSIYNTNVQLPVSMAPTR